MNVLTWLLLGCIFLVVPYFELILNDRGDAVATLVSAILLLVILHQEGVNKNE